MQNPNRTMEEPELAVVYLLFQTGPSYDKHKPILALKRLLARLPWRKTIVYVDNSAPESPCARQTAPREYAISGDNRYLEFSGWQRGIEYLRNQGKRPDVWLLVNDTFLTQSAMQRIAFQANTLECVLMRKAILGNRRTLPPGAEIMGNLLIPYIRTHFFLVAGEIIEQLSSVVGLDENSIDRLLLSEFDPSVRLFRKDAPCSEQMRQLIFSNLTNEWYRRKPYVADSFVELRAKATSILNSVLLSLRIDQLGYPLIPYTKAGAFLDQDVSRERIREEWIGGHGPAVQPMDQRGDGWRVKPPVYRRVTRMKHPFTLGNLLDLIESRPGREHM